MTELSKYRNKLRANEDIKTFDNIITNCKTNLSQMCESVCKTEAEFLEFKLRTLKELEKLTSSDILVQQEQWMESPFDVYSNQ